MRKRIFIGCFCILSIIHMDAAQRPKDSASRKPAQLIDSACAMGYIWLGESFDPGRLSIPMTNFELAAVTTGTLGAGSKNNSYERIGITRTAGLNYACGVEAFSACTSSLFTSVGIGVSRYTYSGTYTDEIFSGTYTSTISGDYGFNFDIAELSLYEFYRLTQNNNKALNFGAGCRLGYVFTESDPGWDPHSFYYPGVFPFLSARLQYRSLKYTLDAYFNYGLVGTSNELASVGLQVGFKL